MPLADPRDIGREQAYGQPQPTKFMGSFPHSRYTPAEIEALGTQGATSQISPATGRLRGLVGPTNYPQFGVGLPPATRAPIDVAMPGQAPPLQPRPAGPQPAGFADIMRNLVSAGVDPARLGLQGMFGQQQPRTIQTTDPGAGYGMSPSGPTARLGSAQFPDTPSDAPRAGTWMHGNVQRPKGQGVIEQFSVPANYGQSPSNPNWRAGPTRTPKPMSPFYEPPVPFRPPTGGP